MKGKTDEAAAKYAGYGIDGGFRTDHSDELTDLDTHGPHGAVLLDAGGDAHGDAVDNVKGGDHSDDGQKTIDEEGEGVKGSCGLPVAESLVRERQLIAQGILAELPDGIDIRVGGIRSQLDIDDRVSIFSSDGRECVFGADEDPVAAGQIKRTLVEGVRHSQRAGGGDNLVSCLERTGGIVSGQHIISVASNVLPAFFTGNFLRVFFAGNFLQALPSGSPAFLFCPSKLVCFVGNQGDGYIFSVIFSGDVGKSAAVNPGDTVHVLNFLCQISADGAAVVCCGHREIRCVRLQRIQGMMHESHEDGESQE